MSATKKGQLKKIAIIAGMGDLPTLLVKECEQQHIIPYIISINHSADSHLLSGRPHLITHFGAVNEIFSFLRIHGVSDIIFTGAMKRPRWSHVRPDRAGISIFLKIIIRALFNQLGDDRLLKLLKNEFQQRGVFLRSIQDILPDLLVPAGCLTKTAPTDAYWHDIHIGYAASQLHGKKDLGQSIIVQNGHVIGYEDRKGTDHLILNTAYNPVELRKAVLVKTCKPQQDKALDLPTIGPKTIQNCIEKGFSGIVIHAQKSLLVDRDVCINLCNQHNVFLYGVTDDEMKADIS